MLKAITILTEKTIKDALLYFWIALCTTSNPTSDATKHAKAKIKAVPICSIPSNRCCNADIVDEKNTMKEHVAAVTYTKQVEFIIQINGKEKDNKGMDLTKRYL